MSALWMKALSSCIRREAGKAAGSAVSRQSHWRSSLRPTLSTISHSVQDGCQSRSCPVRHYQTNPWMNPSPFASKDRRKDGLELYGYKDVLVWVDCEMTGLRNHDVLLEVALLLTDNSLSVVAEGLNVVIHQPEEILETMLPEVRDMHTKTGLLERVRASTVSVEDADKQVIEHMRMFLNEEDLFIMAGSSVHVDLNVIRRFMPLTAAQFSHRVLDVSTVYEIVKRWSPHVIPIIDRSRQQFSTHEATSDILASISHLRAMREHSFVGTFKS